MTGPIEHSIPCRKKPISAFPACRFETSRRGSMRFPQGRLALRPNERSDVGWPPPVWKDIFSALSSLAASPVSSSRCRRGTATSPFASLGGFTPHRITVLDINADMLEVGRQRAAKRRFEAKLDFVEANAEVLPFADNSFDAYTIAFGIRNVRGSIRRSPRPPGPEARRPIPLASNSPMSKCLFSTGSMTSIPFAPSLCSAGW